MVDPARVERCGAARMGTAAVHRPQRPAMSPVGQTTLPADVEHLTRPAEHDRHDVGLTTEPAQRRCGQRLSLRRLARRGVVEAVQQGLIVDQHRHLRHPLVARGPSPGEQVDDHVGLQLVPGAVIVLIGVADGGDGGVDRRPRPGIGQRIERQQRLAHAGVFVDPTANIAIATQPLLPRQPFISGQIASQILALAIELLRRGPRSSPDQCLLVLGQPRPAFVVEVTGRFDEGVDVASCHRPLGQRLTNARQQLTDLAALGGSLGVTPGPPPTPGQHRRRIGGATCRSQPGRPYSDPRIDRIEPAPQPQRPANQTVEPATILLIRLSNQQLDEGVDHRPIIGLVALHELPRTHVPMMTGGCNSPNTGARSPAS